MNLPAFFIYVLTTTFTPGPNNLMAMSNGLHTGFKRTAKFLSGVFSGFLLVMLICGFVNFVFNQPSPLSQALDKPARRRLHALSGIPHYHLQPHKEEPNQGLNTYKAGLSMQFINPKLILYGITVFSNFIIPNYQSSFSVLLFSIFLATVGLVASSSWAAFGVIFRTFFAKYARIINLAMGLLSIYSAIASLEFMH